MALKPIKVSQLNSYIKRILQTDPLLGNVSVVGEISNLKYHGSGHVYFTLKDEGSKLNCFLPADVLKEIRYELSDGMEINASGYIYLYERGGTYSLNIRNIMIEGVGNLSIAFEKLREKLSQEGLFDDKYKKEIPFFPKKIAVITSETGAAVRDILKIIQSRNRIVDILVFPCLVQGPAAAGEIAKAIAEVNRLFPETDTLIVGRGGGSMEELWAFNEEIVARSIFTSNIPVISAVGHETDFTIADFVADKRAETPTAAAQMAAPDIKVLQESIHSLCSQLFLEVKSRIRYTNIRLESNNMIALKNSLLRKIEMLLMRTDYLKEELFHGTERKMTVWENAIIGGKASLEYLNPFHIMERGYAAITDAGGSFVSSVTAIKQGDKLTAVFRDGQADCLVENLRRESDGDKNDAEGK